MAYVNLLEIVYPIGSLYFSVVNTSPASIVGGTWQRISGACIRAFADGDNIGIGNYGGEDAHTLSVAEMPRHNHETPWLDTPWNDRRITTNQWIPHDYFWQSQAIEKVCDNGLINYIGNSQPHNNLPRVYECYVWKRTA